MAFVGVTGAITNNDELYVELFSATTAPGSIFILVDGTFGSTIFPEVTVDDVTWFQIGLSSTLLDGQVYNDIQAPGQWLANVSGFMRFRLRGAAVTGTANCSIGSSDGINIITAIQGISYVEQISSSAWTAGGVYNVTPPSLSDGQKSALQLDSEGRLIVSAEIAPSAGGATEAAQDVGNTSLDSIDDKTPALGQADMAASTPVVLASNQSSIPVAATLSAETTKVIGTVNVSAAQSITATQATGSNLHTVVDSGTITTVSTVTSVTAIANALPAGNNNIGDVDITSIAAGDNNIGNVDVVTLPSIPAGTNNIGDVDVLTLPALSAGTNRIGSVRPVDSSDADLTSVKGTQTARAVGTQDLKDSGRVELRYYAVAAAAGTTTTETAITLTKSSGTAATSTGTSFVITSGKRFRITNIIFATRSHATATIQSTTFNLRVNTGGAVITSSTPIVLAARCANAAVASAWDRAYFDFNEGWEIAGDGTLQFGVTAAATYTTNAPTWDVAIMGYEY